MLRGALLDGVAAFLALRPCFCFFCTALRQSAALGVCESYALTEDSRAVWDAVGWHRSYC